MTNRNYNIDDAVSHLHRALDTLSPDADNGRLSDDQVRGYYLIIDALSYLRGADNASQEHMEESRRRFKTMITMEDEYREY